MSPSDTWRGLKCWTTTYMSPFNTFGLRVCWDLHMKWRQVTPTTVTTVTTVTTKAYQKLLKSPMSPSDTWRRAMTVILGNMTLLPVTILCHATLDVARHRVHESDKTSKIFVVQKSLSILSFIQKMHTTMTLATEAICVMLPVTMLCHATWATLDDRVTWIR